MLELKTKETGLLLRLARGLALVSAFVGLLCLWDALFAKAAIDTAIIREKHPKLAEISAQGELAHREGVPRKFFNGVEIGDQINLSLTPLFKEWRAVSIQSATGKVLQSRGTDILPMIGIACALLLPSLAYSRDVLTWLRDKGLSLTFWIVVSVCEFVSTIIFTKLLFYWSGFVEKL